MKRFVALSLCSAALLAQPASADIMITGYLDGTFATAGSTSRVLELYALTDIADINDYRIQRAANGGGWANAVVTWDDLIAIPAGTFFYVHPSAEDKADLELGFGVGTMDPSEITGGINFNGNDAIRILREADDAVLDTLGDPADVIDSGDFTAPWAHPDGWVYRNDFTGPDADSFSPASWTVMPNTEYTGFPLGSFTLTPDLIPGDTDNDGDVDDSDLGTAFSNYTGPLDPGTGGKTPQQGDTDADGDVDDSDLGTAFSSYTGPLNASVPEPASLATMGVLVLGVASRRRRR